MGLPALPTGHRGTGFHVFPAWLLSSEKASTGFLLTMAPPAPITVPGTQQEPRCCGQTLNKGIQQAVGDQAPEGFWCAGTCQCMG